jgi:YjjG family noncanonical pyrimidine nucleotidase
MMKKPYDWILFDADETLFHFDDFQGLQRMFTSFDVNFTEADYREYQTTNKPLWVAYQNHQLTAKQVQEKRFELWGERLGVPPGVLNSAFLRAMWEICEPIDGALDLVDKLKGKAKLGIITNGFTELQKIRLEKTGFDEYIDLLVVSEEVGIAKPHPAIFNHALERMGHPDRNKVLMVGDNPDSDILGALNAGLHSCWLNRHNHQIRADITPHYVVSSLKELMGLLCL